MEYSLVPEVRMVGIIVGILVLAMLAIGFIRLVYSVIDE